MTDIQQALAKVVEHENLTEQDMIQVMEQIMSGKATDAQIGGFLIALRMKGETVDEITGAVRVMRQLATPVSIDSEHLIDTCGTGGDGANLFNVSTASAFVVAAAGGMVAKHGNRGASSNSGSADVLEAAGVKITLTSEQVERCIKHVGVGFMFAQTHHGAMKYAIGPRKEMKTRTLFNMLGPMTNPAGTKKQVIGVFSEQVMDLMASVLLKLGSTHVVLVHSEDHLDEMSIAEKSFITEIHNGEIKKYKLSPEDFGLKLQSLDGLQVTDAANSLALIQGAFSHTEGENFEKARNMIALNSALAIYAADLCADVHSAFDLAQDILATGQASNKLQELIDFSNSFGSGK